MEHLNETKQCKGCNKVKLLSEYYRRGGVRGGDVLRAECKTCTKDAKRDYNRANARIWKQNNREKVELEYKRRNDKRKAERLANEGMAGREKQIARRSDLKRLFNLTPDEYINLFNAQSGLCGICGNLEKARHRKYGTIRLLAVDHDHITGVVRGLLCTACNFKLGRIEDLSFIKLAQNYLLGIKNCTDYRDGESEQCIYLSFKSNWQEAHFKRYSNFSYNKYIALLQSQNGLCAICGNPEKAKNKRGYTRSLTTDHNHVTGEVRGLLCTVCNLKLGVLECQSFMDKARIYLARYNVV